MWQNKRRTCPWLDVVKPIILRNNRWRCDHGWDIDLDDGSSNYQIIDNLCLNRGIKNREGFHRVVENNILVNSTYYPQVWPAQSQDVFSHNIVWRGIQPRTHASPPWGKEMDENFVQKPGADGPAARHAIANAKRARRTFPSRRRPIHRSRLRELRCQTRFAGRSALGFVNFPMDQFGVQNPQLKAIARTPELPGPPGSGPRQLSRDGTVKNWNGASVRNILDEGEMSAYGTPGVTGVLVLKVDPASELARIGLRPNDVILGLNDSAVVSITDLFRGNAARTPGRPLKIKILRNQQQISLP